MTNTRHGIRYAENARPYFPMQRNIVRSAERSKTIKSKTIKNEMRHNMTMYMKKFLSACAEA